MHIPVYENPELIAKTINNLHRYLLIFFELDVNSKFYNFYKAIGLGNQFKEYAANTKLSEKFTNQILNTLLYDNPSTEQLYIGQEYPIVKSVAPDDLIWSGIDGYNNKTQLEKFSIYNAVEDYTQAGGYYIKL